jgi:hypothetical protein
LTVPRFVCALVALGALALYLYTALPEPGWVDSGELAVVSHTLGIPHPTGSPLYVLVSRVFTVIVPGAFFPLTLLSALATAAGVWTVSRLPIARGSNGGRAGSVGAPAAAAMLAVAPTIWSGATLNEVYALQFALFAAFLYVWLHRELRFGALLSAYLAGLAFANHQSAIFLLPLLVLQLWPGRGRARRLSTAVALGLLGMTVYLYLPIRSAAGPLLDWGGTHRLAAFVRHITGWQYSVWVGADWTQLKDGLAALGGWTWANFTGGLLGLVLLGVYGLWRTDRRLLWITLAAAAICVGFGLNFPNPDVESFYLLFFLLVALVAGAGVDLYWNRGTAWRYFIGLAVGVSIAASVVVHFAQQNRRDFRVPSDWVRDALETVEAGSLVLTREWDHYSPWLYLRFVTGFRPDVTWIDTELLRRSWYPAYIRKVDPERYRLAEPALDRLAPEIARFEAGQPYDPARIEGAYADAIYALSLAQPGAVHFDGVAGQPEAWGVERVYLRGAHEVPWGLFTLAVRPSEPAPPLPPWPDYRNASAGAQGDLRAQFHLGLYERARRARAAFGR